MRRYIEVPIRLLDLDGDGFHVMVEGTIHGKVANFLVDTGASRSVFDALHIADFIGAPHFEPKESLSAGVGGNDLETSVFVIAAWSIGELEINDYKAVAIDLSNVHELYAKLFLPRIDGIIGGDLLAKHKAVINYRSLKMRLTP